MAGAFWRVRALTVSGKATECDVTSLAALCWKTAQTGLCQPEDTAAVARVASAMVLGQVAVAEDPGIRRAALAVTAIALARQGRQVHLLFALPGLAQQFRQATADFFDQMGLPIAAIPEAAENDLRRDCYGAPVVAAGVLQVATDHLRDRRMGLTRRFGARFLTQSLAEGTAARRAYLCGPLDVALIDGFADIAIEAAGRPVQLQDDMELINDARVAREALALALRMRRATDFATNGQGDPALTDEGRRRSERLALSFGPLWASAAWRDKTLDAALTVLFAMKPHKDYAIIHGSAELADPIRATRLSRCSLVPVQSLVLAKESGDRPDGEIASEMSLRRMLDRYRHLAGVTGPVPGLERDVWQLYALTSRNTAPTRKVRRGRLDIVAHDDDEAKWRAIAARVDALADGGGKVVLVAPFATASKESILANLPSTLRDGVVVATRPEDVEAVCADGDPPVLFAGAETARWRDPKALMVWRARPGAAIELHASWDDAAIHAVRDRRGMALRRAVGWPSTRLMAAALASADRLERRAASGYRAARTRWESAMEQAFGFTGENE
ncbi:hypothetical protein [Sedimentitalea xiamensis]|uniref:hypothetical protein n=1 Tax=Sedimentitalea xiamensis TaxID=3050037 RepID=UPI002540A496|nr:hypothetical protein [Sedimentitalea xiamensis]